MFLAGLRMPTDIERGAIGGPRFNTTVLSLESGYEKRNVNWQDSRGQWDVGYGLLKKFREVGESATELDVAYLISMFRTCRGRAHSFRFKDWSDYEVGYRYDQPADPQYLADSGAETIQAFKRYQLDVLDPEDRIITKLVEDTVVLYVGGVELTSGYSVNYDTGVITLSAPAGGEVTGRFQFDCHCRFDTDDLRIAMHMFHAGEWQDIPIVELLGTGVE